MIIAEELLYIFDICSYIREHPVVARVCLEKGIISKRLFAQRSTRMISAVCRTSESVVKYIYMGWRVVGYIYVEYNKG